MFRSRKYLSLATWLSMLAMLSFSIQGQQSNSSKEWFVNFPSSPLHISLMSKERAVKFDNRSTGDIVSFRVGCVSYEKDSFAVFEVLNERRRNITAGLYYGKFTVDLRVTFLPASEFEDDMNHCEKLKTKVAVIEVEFSDGATWKAKS